jgi:hypothetical protein
MTSRPGSPLWSPCRTWATTRGDDSSGGLRIRCSPGIGTTPLTQQGGHGWTEGLTGCPPSGVEDGSLTGCDVGTAGHCTETTSAWKRKLVIESATRVVAIDSLRADILGQIAGLPQLVNTCSPARRGRAHAGHTRGNVDRTLASRDGSHPGPRRGTRGLLAGTAQAPPRVGAMLIEIP